MTVLEMVMLDSC